MALQLQKDLDFLRKEIMTVAAMVEEATNKAIIALMEKRPDLAEQVIADDAKIDAKEVELERECLRILALHQPMAGDHRFIIAIIKINNDLERIGDLAANIAKRSTYLSGLKNDEIIESFAKMCQNVQDMLKKSISAFAQNDRKLAKSILKMDDLVDNANKDMFIKLQKIMFESPESIEGAIHLLSVSRHLERIADLSTNIAEDVIYMVKGSFIRHNKILKTLRKK